MEFKNDEKAHEFVITIPRQTFDEQDNEKSNQAEELSSDKSNQVEEPSSDKSNQVTNQVTNQVANQVANGVTNQVANGVSLRQLTKKELTGKQIDIINFCSVPRSAAEIMERLSLTNQSYNRAKYIQPLVESGFLKMTNPESVNAPNQKYVKVKRK